MRVVTAVEDVSLLSGRCTRRRMSVGKRVVVGHELIKIGMKSISNRWNLLV